MSRNDPTGAEPEACPFVGLADDPRTRFSFPVQGHRCHVRSKPAKIDLAWQGAYCLSSDFPACDRYRPPTAGLAGVGAHGLTVAAAVAREPEDAGTGPSSEATDPGPWPAVEPAVELAAEAAVLVSESAPEPEVAQEPEAMAEPETTPVPEPASTSEPEPEPALDLRAGAVDHA